MDSNADHRRVDDWTLRYTDDGGRAWLKPTALPRDPPVSTTVGLPQAPLVGVIALGQERRQAVEDHHAGDGVLLLVFWVAPLPGG